MDQHVRLAKDTIETYLETGKVISPPDNLPKEMLANQAGVFVSIHKKNGELRGCIGTFLSTKANIAQEIITNALASATQDPRFPSVTSVELPSLVYSVDILSLPRLATRKEINPKKYGLIVSTEDGRRGLLLPDIPGVETPGQQFEICCHKAGISPKEKTKFEVFTVERHE
jgi:AmmeMemoRadiSam system protein A